MSHTTKMKFLGCAISVGWSHSFDFIRWLGISISCAKWAIFCLNKQSNCYKAYLLPAFDYCDIVWNCCTEHQATLLGRLQNYCKRNYCEGALCYLCLLWICECLGLSILKARRNLHAVELVFKSQNNLAPPYLKLLLTPVWDVHQHNTRLATTKNLRLPPPKTGFGKKVLPPSCGIASDSVDKDPRVKTSCSPIVLLKLQYCSSFSWSIEHRSYEPLSNQVYKRVLLPTNTTYLSSWCYWANLSLIINFHLVNYSQVNHNFSLSLPLTLVELLSQVLCKYMT